MAKRRRRRREQRKPLSLEEMKTYKGFVSDHDVAFALGVSRRTVQQWRQHGKGPAYRKNGATKSSSVRYDPADVIAFARIVETANT